MEKDFRKYINALRKCANEHEKDFVPTFNIRTTDLCNDTANLLEQAEKDIKALQNRCFALSNGTMCLFCPMDCDRRSIAYRGDVQK